MPRKLTGEAKPPERTNVLEAILICLVLAADNARRKILTGRKGPFIVVAMLSGLCIMGGYYSATEDEPCFIT